VEGIAEAAGLALRRARTANGLTLREVVRRSNGIFKASTVAAYERGERAISLQRFCDLAGVYGIAPELLVGEIMNTLRRGLDLVIDLTGDELDPVSGAPQGG
jgi:transcriptional regulator with XRE-family HTH domain